MASLSSSLHIALSGLNAATGAIQIVNNNIANANTAGYTRQVALNYASLDSQGNSTGMGNGVDFTGYLSIRDELLQTRVRQETEAQSAANAELSSMQTIETSFTNSSSASGIGTEINALFTSLSDLSSNPSSSPLRQSVLTAGENLVAAIHSASAALKTEQNGLNSQVDSNVDQINVLSQQIAALNVQVVSAQQLRGGDGGTVQDTQEQLILQLSALTNVNVTRTDNGVTISTGTGTPLVVGNQSYALQTSTSAAGRTLVLDANGADISSTLTMGALGGTLVTRDQSIAKLKTQLDTLAYDLGTAFNAAQASGYDANGVAGVNFFTLPSSAAGAADSISVALSDPDTIAASTDGSTGGNGNLGNFAAIQTTKLASGMTPTDAYSAIVYQVGSLTSNAQAELDASTATLNQLNDQLNAASGVSIDEEAANLVQFQQAYAASAHVISTVQELFSTLMNAVS